MRSSLKLTKEKITLISASRSTKNKPRIPKSSLNLKKPKDKKVISNNGSLRPVVRFFRRLITQIS